MRAGMSFSLLLLLPRRSLAAFVAPPAHTLIERAGVRHGGRRAERERGGAHGARRGGGRVLVGAALDLERREQPAWPWSICETRRSAE